MAIRLRSGPPRRRSRFPTAARVGVAALALAALPFGAVRLRSSGADPPIFRIERLPATDGDGVSAGPPPPLQPFLTTHRVVSYYGNPLAPQMGVLGEYPPDEVIRRLRAQAAAYQPLSPDRTVVPAIHFIYAVAQEQPGSDGSYLLRMDDDLVWQWVQLTRDNGLLLFLDIQLGRSTIDREFAHVAPFLTEPHVHLAIDPEFAWGPDEYPLVDIGHIDASVVNRAQQLLEDLIIKNHLPNKILIVHQFRPDMLTNKASIIPSDRVETVIDADGFGPRGVKLGQWNSVIRDDHVQRAGIKLFYKHDAELDRLMTEAEVMQLTPAPVVIIYQ